MLHKSVSEETAFDLTLSLYIPSVYKDILKISPELLVASGLATTPLDLYTVFHGHITSAFRILAVG